MASAPITRPSLLVRVRDAGDGPAWSQFVDLYGPLIFAFGRRQGLQDADAADLTQEVLARVCQAVRALDYDPAHGTFRSWLYTVTRNCFITFVRRCQRHESAGGAEQLLADRPAADAEETWRSEYRRRLFGWAAEQVRGEVSTQAWQAFWETGVMGRAARDVAAELGMSVAAVYMAKSRTLERIRAEIRLTEGDGEDPTEVLHG
jgi:RNA polymerase sigma factor (sigma-70 family)